MPASNSSNPSCRTATAIARTRGDDDDGDNNERDDAVPAQLSRRFFVILVHLPTVLGTPLPNGHHRHHHMLACLTAAYARQHG
mmetsp:Transcript_27626/g.38574  ORF Transcript_27626/g.38574 Transcript_27626/m.38574 type:complete len:83 (+) Transcript_27626:1291-1539(+)